MLLAEDSQIAPNSIRTIKLSTRSFLHATLSEGSLPLYSFETKDARTTFKRHDRSKNSQSTDGLTEIALIHWSELESPESSSVESPTSLKNRILPKHFLSSSCPKDPSVLVDVDGKRSKVSELIKSQPLGGSRKFNVDGKSFKWKQIAGLWQCFYSSNHIAVFEPSILTAAARLRIIPCPDVLSITRRVLDHIVLTCMLLVTHPSEWRKPLQKQRHPKLERSVSMGFNVPGRPPNPLYLQQSRRPATIGNAALTLPPTHINRSDNRHSLPLDMRRSHSNPSSSRQQVAHSTIERFPVPGPVRTTSLPAGTRTVQPIITSLGSMHPFPSSSTPTSPSRPLPPIPLVNGSTSIRRHSQRPTINASAIQTPSSPISPLSQQNNALTILSRSSSTAESSSGNSRPMSMSSNLRRALSQYNLLPITTEEGVSVRSPSDHLISPTIPPSVFERRRSEEGQMDGGYELGVGASGPAHIPRIWERPSAYPIPYHDSSIGHGEDEDPISPPPYTPRIRPRQREDGDVKRRRGLRRTQSQGIRQSPAEGGNAERSRLVVVS